MAITIPNLTFTRLDINAAVATAWGPQQQAIEKAPAAAAEQTSAAVKTILGTITQTMATYQAEETAYFDAVQKLHGECKAHAQETLRLLKACKDIQPGDANRARLLQGSIDRMRLMAADVDKAVAALAQWENDMVAHQGVRSELAPPNSMVTTLDAKFRDLMHQQFAKLRQPMITRMAKEKDSVVKVEQFKQRIDDCIKMTTTLQKDAGQDAAELEASWREVKTSANKLKDLKVPELVTMKSRLEILKKNDAKDRNLIQTSASNSVPTWVAQIKSARSTLKTIKLKYDNFFSVNKNAKSHPTIGKELVDVDKQIASTERMFDERAEWAEKCQKRLKELKL